MIGLLLGHIRDSLFTVVYPLSCSVCGGSVESSRDGSACGRCWEKTRVFAGSETLCEKCGAFLSENAGVGSSCGKCPDHNYDFAFSAGIYESALLSSVLELKRCPRIAPRVKRLIVGRLSAISHCKPDLIIPVPLSKKRRIERGFNQAELVAALAASELKIPVRKKVLLREVHTPMHRAGMDKKAREMTVRNAFSVQDAGEIQGRSILLVDDVMTSGSTVSHCSRILKKNGAAKVTVFTIARTV